MTLVHGIIHCGFAGAELEFVFNVALNNGPEAQNRQKNELYNCQQVTVDWCLIPAHLTVNC